MSLFTNPFIYVEEVLDEMPQNAPFQHTDYFKLKVTKIQQTQKKMLSASPKSA